uniref:Uncharacterized protein n=1 Tax=Daphnia magna TaxID=35525 RepID=A0A0P5EJA9_9CRUS
MTTSLNRRFLFNSKLRSALNKERSRLKNNSHAFVDFLIWYRFIQSYCGVCSPNTCLSGASPRHQQWGSIATVTFPPNGNYYFYFLFVLLN